MTQPPLNQLTTLQQTILATVQKYPGRFSRSGLAKMLVGAKSWQGRGVPEYGSLSKFRRKDVLYQADIMLQQGDLDLDSREYLILPAPGS